MVSNAGVIQQLAVDNHRKLRNINQNWGCLHQTQNIGGACTHTLIIGGAVHPLHPRLLHPCTDHVVELADSTNMGVIDSNVTCNILVIASRYLLR